MVGKLSLRVRTAAASSPGCTPPSWPLCSWAAWPRCCSWAPRSSAAAATAAGRPRRAPATVARPAADREGILGVDTQTVFTASAVAAVAFLALSALAFARPATKPIAVKTPYTEKVSFGYHAKAPAGPVYPDGVVTTGDPIFLKLVHRVRVKAHYRLTATAPQRVGGTMEVLLRLTSPTGWNRTIQLAAPKRFTGDYAGADVTLDVPALQSLIRKVEKLTGGTPGAAYNLSIIAAGPRDRHAGQPAAHQRLRAGAEPSARRSAAAGRRAARRPRRRPGQGGLTPSRPGHRVATASTKPNTLTVRGHAVPVTTARWIALIGFLLAASAALLSGVRLLGDSSDPTSHVNRYRHLIVPIAGTTFDPARPPIDVTSIQALAQLAERSERLILHHQRDGADTYLVDDEGTLYRYQALPPPCASFRRCQRSTTRSTRARPAEARRQPASRPRGRRGVDAELAVPGGQVGLDGLDAQGAPGRSRGCPCRRRELADLALARGQ